MSEPRARLPVNTDITRWEFANTKGGRFYLVPESEADTLILCRAFGSTIRFEWPGQADLAEQVGIMVSAAFRAGQRDKADQFRRCLEIDDWHDDQHPQSQD